MSTPGTAPSTCSPATGSIWRRPTASTSGNDNEGPDANPAPFRFRLPKEISPMRNRKFLFAAVLLAGAAPILASAAQPNRPAAGHAQYGNWGVDLAGRDLSVKPGDDFWAYANQTFMRTHPIPADKTSYGLGDVLDDQIQ